MMKIILSMCAVLITVSASAGEIPNIPFIQTTGEATVHTPPTYAKVTFSVKQEAKTSDENLKKLTKRYIEIISLLKRLKISQESFEAEPAEKYVVKKSVEGSMFEQVKVGYGLTQSYNLYVKNLKMYPTLITELLKLDFISSPLSSFETEKRGVEEERLLIKALSSARQKAEKLAKAAGSEVIGVFAISDVRFKELYNVFFEGGGAYSVCGYSPSYGIESVNERDLAQVPSSIVIYTKVHGIFKIK